MRRLRVGWALFRRWLWLLWPPHLFGGWRAYTSYIGREHVLLGRFSFHIFRITGVSVYRVSPVSGWEVSRLFYEEKEEEIT